MRVLALGAFLGLELAATSAADAVYRGTCDASAAVALSRVAFVAASDEESRLRVYAFEPPGLPLRECKLGAFLEQDGKRGEADIEGAARLGDKVYWITSHGRNKEGQERPGRRRFFATRVVGDGLGVDLKVVGRPYTGLLADLTDDPALASLHFREASARGPQERGGLNIEALSAWGAGQLILGFRNPLVAGHAVLIPLLNPDSVVEGRSRAQFGLPVLLQLGGRGVRDMVATPHGYYLVAGNPGGGGASRLYRWQGGVDKPERVRELDLKGFNAESIVFVEGQGRSRLVVFSDDGGREVAGVPCMDLTPAAARTFRSRILGLERGE